MKFTAICENHLYQKAYSKGKREVTSALAVYILPDYSAKRLAKAHPLHIIQNRIGLTTGKTLGGAVVRNRCRRLMREALREVIRMHPIKTGYLIVIAARHGMIGMKTPEVGDQLHYAFKKLGIFEDKL